MVCTQIVPIAVWCDLLNLKFCFWTGRSGFEQYALFETKQVCSEAQKILIEIQFLRKKIKKKKVG